jgi:hypothetical protein
MLSVAVSSFVAIVFIAAMGTNAMPQFHRVLWVRGRSRIPELWLRQLRFRGSDSADHQRPASKAVYFETPTANANTEATAGAEASSNRTQPVTDPDTKDSQTSHDISTGWRIVGTVAGQATLVAALLFYFGWARTQAVMGYFGINSAIARLSVNDYILRSLSITIRMLIILGLLTLILLSGHRWLSTTLASRQRPFMARLAMLACVVPGFLLCIAGVLGFYNWVVYSTQYPFVPIMFAVGVTLVAYGFHIRSFVQPNLQPHKWSARTQTATLVILNIALIFWAVAAYANITGQRAGELLASNLTAQPSVIIYSEKSLGLTTPVKVQQLPGNDSQYRYRYSNLKLLLYSTGQYFLVPDNWKRGHDPVFLINEGNEIRFEFYTGS